MSRLADILPKSQCAPGCQVRLALRTPFRDRFVPWLNDDVVNTDASHVSCPARGWLELMSLCDDEAPRNRSKDRRYQSRTGFLASSPFLTASIGCFDRREDRTLSFSPMFFPGDLPRRLAAPIDSPSPGEAGQMQRGSSAQATTASSGVLLSMRQGVGSEKVARNCGGRSPESRTGGGC